MLTHEIPPDFRYDAHLFIFKPPYAIGPVPSLSGHAIAYRWRSLPGVRRHRASKPQGSSKRVLPWQVTMDQLICASLSHTHYYYYYYYWYEVGMLKWLVYTNSRLKVPACTTTASRPIFYPSSCRHKCYIRYSVNYKQHGPNR